MLFRSVLWPSSYTLIVYAVSFVFGVKLTYLIALAAVVVKSVAKSTVV